MSNKGVKLGARLGTGSYGTTFKATSTKSFKGPICVKIPINLDFQKKNVVSGSLKKEIECLESLHSPENQGEFRGELGSIVKPIMKDIMLFGNEPVLVAKYYPFTL